jgi:hypothetical protein
MFSYFSNSHNLQIVAATKPDDEDHKTWSTKVHTYHLRFIRYSSHTFYFLTFYQNDFAMRKTANMLGGKPILGVSIVSSLEL